MKKFQPNRDLPQLVGVSVADKKEIVCANASPIVARLRHGRSWETKHGDEKNSD
jgi:hypothetical protein